ncbi:MAG: tRNA (adenosine(37)-N6)-threonylcarbamoyltransferase complex transferase subunit TsaD [Candidatus Omnitrophica bacterium]|nr:tRNA (adenosine(37)-N6)-threonylcarbamoyltransferase complex transferase subunit TsaD [Candidatus Omnitrophota bacterium]
MLTLGVETSCDETSCAILEDDSRILSNIVSSSLFRHQEFGGVVPEIASRHCLEQIDAVYHEALKEARIQPSDIDLIAATQGPGLIGSLFVGVSFAKALSYALGIPLIGVNHLEAHLLANFIDQPEPEKYIGLLVSGGHTSLTYHEHGKICLLGSTVDDAIGEAFDKVAKILGLGYPGGPAIEELAIKGDPRAIPFTKPKQTNPFDFSFSGIKTAVLYFVEKKNFERRDIKQIGKSIRKGRSKESVYIKPSQQEEAPWLRDLAASFQHAVTQWVVQKTVAAAKDKKVKTIAVGGGVSANTYLRAQLQEVAREEGLKIYFPPLSLTVDNAAMIARRGVELYRNGKRSEMTLSGVPNLVLGGKS